MTRPIAIDLFAGFRVLAGVEIDGLAVETYRKNHRGVKVWDTDIRKLAAKQLMDYHGLAPGELDLLIGCPPCQAFSAMRRLNGSRRVRDKASKDLVFEYLRFVRALRPKAILIENVPRLVDDYRFQELRKELRKLGYEGEPAILDAADYGVPQRRRRMVFVASRVGPIELVAPAKPPRPQTVRDAIGKLPKPGKSGDPLHDLPETRSPKVKRLIARVPKDGGSRHALGEKSQLACHKRCDGFKDVYGRMAWDKVAPTITSGCVNPSKGRFLHPTQNRCITLREAALLQSFPRRYYFSLARGKFPAALLIGNAFPPRFVKAHAKQILRSLEIHLSREVEAVRCRASSD